jgi:DNA polymerase-1
MEFRMFLAMADLPEVDRLNIDTEANGDSLKDGTGYTTGLSIDITPDKGLNAYSYFFPFRLLEGNLSHDYLEKLKELIERKGKWRAQNFRHDWLALKSLGIDPPFDVECTMLMAHQVNENMLSYSLNSLARGLGYDGKAKDENFDRVIKLLGWGGVPASFLAEYAATDASLLRPIADHYITEYYKEDESDGKLWEFDRKVAIILNKIEGTGAKVNLDLAEREIVRGESRMSELAKLIGLNPGSTKQLSELLFDRLGIPVNDKFRSAKTGKPSLNKQAMEYYEEQLHALGSPVAKQVLEYRGYQKAVSSYWKAYLTHVSPDGRIRPNFNLHRTKTHRLSCDTPNLQQIPRITEQPWNKLVKPGFIAEDGYELWEADYSQIELRLTAVYAKEQTLIDIFTDAERDLFTEMATALGLPRTLVKTGVYATGYGAGLDRLASVFGSMALASQFKNQYYGNYPGILKATQLASAVARNKGIVRAWNKRPRHIREESHKAFNSAIQMGASDIVKMQMIKIDEEIGVDNPECRTILQVHDALVFEIEKGKVEYYRKEIPRIMEDVVPDFGVPFRVDMHKWGS